MLALHVSGVASCSKRQQGRRWGSVWLLYRLPSWFATVSRSDCRFVLHVSTWLSDRCVYSGVVPRLTPLTEGVLGVKGAAG